MEQQTQSDQNELKYVYEESIGPAIEDAWTNIKNNTEKSFKEVDDELKNSVIPSKRRCPRNLGWIEK